jgi:phosphopantothenoylcysteine decarboxylase/phosphopantothenate--cysteine ligase
MANTLDGKTILLGVTGGIAAYKAVEICSKLVRSGASVHVVMTEHATHFVGPVTFRAITGHQVLTGLWDEPREYEIAHVSLPDKADLVLIAPATANIIGKIANGIADDMLSTMVMASRAPIVLAPAMNYKMWENPVTQANIERLKRLGYIVVDPETGRLACGEEGTGRLASLEKIIEAVVACLSRKHDYEGVGVMVTAGPTQEAIDPVRYISNKSSGKMGYAIAQVAVERGARVILVSGPTSISPPAGVELVRVTTAAEMAQAVLQRLSEVKVVVGAAAVADYTPKLVAGEKIKKGKDELSLVLVPTVDIMAEVGKRKEDRILVIFAAETENLVENAQKKLEEKNADLVVANDVSKPGIGFGSDKNEVIIIGREYREQLPCLPKVEVANRVLDAVKTLLK